jgi:hypothetical protein
VPPEFYYTDGTPVIPPNAGVVVDWRASVPRLPIQATETVALQPEEIVTNKVGSGTGSSQKLVGDHADIHPVATAPGTNAVVRDFRNSHLA